MTKTYLMKFVTDLRGRLDRIGGLPSHLPDSFPVGPNGEELAFLAQFECIAPRLEIPGIKFIQIYQDLVGEPWPHAVTLGHDAIENIEQVGVRHPNLSRYEIIWNEYEEPVEPYDWDGVEVLSEIEEGILQSPKAGGFCYLDSTISSDEQFLLQLPEEDLSPNNRIFGGLTLLIVLNSNGEVEALLG
ncbi:hypothetical protein Mal35_20240 [Gimesia maris]|uniref:hypothetical protein n=1 Tax=Gimesia maris TaxID=122 RepID=UPI00118A2A84|nr:hypothetical protein [Gimesia maris]QDT78575.1 hypothetical protein Mal35_20240 [Gimesia maris]